jgi:aryl-alcohol dehydrogenase-like predicted oxidoreductase
MRYVELPVAAAAGGAKMSVLGFGCAALLGRASRKESLTALGTAFDAGITFYDTARSYGYGGSEGLLGEFFAGRRDQVVICTKFGILPASQGGWKQKIKPLARAVVKAVPALRKAAQQQAASQFVGGQFDVATLKTSFETSLRELRTDYVDMLIMHAAPGSVLAQGDLLEAMGRLVESGKVRMAGISAELPVISRYFAERPKPLTTAQFALNLSSMDFVAETQRNADLLLVANHPFGGPGGNASARIDALRESEALPQSLREKLGAGDPQVLPEMVLNCILDGTGVAAVIPAMMQPRHIASNVAAVERCRFNSEELELVRQALAGA